MLYFLNSQMLREEVGAGDLNRGIWWNLETLQTANTCEKNLPTFPFYSRLLPPTLLLAYLMWGRDHISLPRWNGCPGIGSILLQLAFSFLVVHQVKQVLKSSTLCHAAYENKFMLKAKWKCIKHLKKKKVTLWKPSCWEPLGQFGEVMWDQEGSQMETPSNKNVRYRISHLGCWWRGQRLGAVSFCVSSSPPRGLELQVMISCFGVLDSS